jgi:hypothetical protein
LNKILNYHHQNFALDNIICMIPYKKEMFYKFIFVIYGVGIQSNENIIVLFAKNSMDFETIEKINSKFTIQIYPPW